MNPITKPMLAGKCERPDALSFPVLATPKLDGIRCLKINGRAMTRSFKPVSNRFTRGWIEANLPDGLDGELIVRGTTFSETAGHIGRESGEPDFTFAVFDYVSDGVDVPGCVYQPRQASALVPGSSKRTVTESVKRAKDSISTFDKYGCKKTAQYWTMGQHDIVIEGSDVSGWGRYDYTNSAGWQVGIDEDSGITARCLLSQRWPKCFWTSRSWPSAASSPTAGTRPNQAVW